MENAKMNSICLFLTLYIQSSFSFFDEEYIWLHTLSEQIRNSEVHKITFFIDDRKYTNEQDMVIKNLTQEIQFQTVDLQKLLADEDNQSVASSVFYDNLYITLSVIFHSLEFESANNIIDTLAKLSPDRTRPRCLIISFNEKSSLEYNIGIILRSAWSKKFLDFSILTVNLNRNIPNCQATIYNFNSFDTRIMQNLFNASTYVFPNKLRNVKGYPMKLPFFHAPPFMTVKHHQNGTIEVEGRHFLFLEFAIKAMNFTTEFTFEIVDPSSAINSSNMVREALKRGDINIISAPSAMTPNEQYKIVELVHECEPLVAVVPILRTITFKIPLKILFCTFFIIPTIVVGLIYVMHLLRIIRDEWKGFNMMQLLLGVPTSMLSQKAANRIIYLSVIIISMTYSMNFFSIILDINLEQSEVPFNSYRDLDRSQFPTYIFELYYDRVFSGISDVHLINLKNRTHTTNNIRGCLQSIESGEKAICILSFWAIEDKMSDYRKNDNSAAIKVANTPLQCNRLGYVFEPASPFTERFAQIQLKIRESGIWYMLSTKGKSNNTVTSNDKRALKQNSFVLLIISGTGYSLATIIFIAEYLNIRQFKDTILNYIESKIK